MELLAVMPLINLALASAALMLILELRGWLKAEREDVQRAVRCAEEAKRAYEEAKKVYGAAGSAEGELPEEEKLWKGRGGG